MPDFPGPYHYEVQGRYGYWGIDLYKGDSCLTCIGSFNTRKQANSIAGALNQAIRYGKEEADANRTSQSV